MDLWFGINCEIIDFFEQLSGRLIQSRDLRHSFVTVPLEPTVYSIKSLVPQNIGSLVL
jgi:hypothetical protein